jgi:DNA ligase 1
MKTLPTLYKLTKTGATQQWQIVIDGNSYYTNAGQVGGKITKSKPTLCAGKNVGRANETTDEEQALLEAQSKWDKKFKRKYTTEAEDIATACPFFEPMLAKGFDKVKNLQYPVLVQQKFDGIRAIFTKDGAKTRNGETHHCVPHISAALKPFFEKYPDAILDGELYNHELHDNFNKIASLIRKQKPTPAQLEEAAEKVQFYCYDMPRLDKDITQATPFVKRLQYLQANVGFINEAIIKVVPTFEAQDEAGVDKFHDVFVQDGYEGAIIRVPGSPYENGRTKSLLKYKRFDDEEFKLIGIRGGKGNKAGLAAHADFENPNGKRPQDKTFTANIKGKEWWRNELLEKKDAAIGSMCTVEFFGKSGYGVPRFPYLIEIRDYE